ncbi:hypothetical protein BIW11_13544 [Tropilaelaps mercedesae]|uniref:RanBP2-type domain-containing protein n=1 Tax=Tropilaelaps mercedesae TaxID=418985 RepID=A0A1V9X1F7_9ACAR|nr:hypothetical protein BIW11_13544 [Tropilaelaps mercedesae]
MKRNVFESLHNRRAGSTSLLSKGNNSRDLSDFEDNILMGSNLQVNRMYPPQSASMNRHQSMMDLSRMAPQGYPGMPYMGHPASFGVLPYGAVYPGMPGVPYGSMSYLNDPRMFPHHWGYAGSTGSFSNLNSSAEGEGKDTDTESTSRIPMATHMNGMGDSRMGSMRRCQSFAPNQWGTLIYPQVPTGSIPFGYPHGVIPYGGYPCGNQWGSGQSMQSVGVGTNPQLSNMDANRAIWYYHNRAKQSPVRADTETSDSDLDFIPRSPRSRSDGRQVARAPSHGDLPRQRRSDSSRDFRQSSPRPAPTRASSVGASDSNPKDYSDPDFDEQRHKQGHRTESLQTMRISRKSDRQPAQISDEYIDPSVFRSEPPPPGGSGPKEKDRLPSAQLTATPKQPSYERATRDDSEQTLAQRPHNSPPMSPHQQRQPGPLPKPDSPDVPHGGSAISRLPERKVGGTQTSAAGENRQSGGKATLPVDGAAEASARSGGLKIEASGRRPSRPAVSPDRDLAIDDATSTSAVSTNDAEPARIRWSPSKQWTCIHCTFINKPGIKICTVCCKTSFKDPSPEKGEQQEEQNHGHQKAVRGQVNAEQAEYFLKKVTEPTDSTMNTSKDVDGFDYEFVKQQREVEQELLRRLENERRIAAENARLEGKSIPTEKCHSAGSANREQARNTLLKGSKSGVTSYDAYEVVEFTSEAESETESNQDTENQEQFKARSLATRFEDKIKSNKEGSSSVVGPYRRMMVNQNGTPKSLSSIDYARSRFEPTSVHASEFFLPNSRPRKSSLKGSDLTPSSSKSSLSTEVSSICQSRKFSRTVKWAM